MRGTGLVTTFWISVHFSDRRWKRYFVGVGIFPIFFNTLLQQLFLFF